MFEVVKAGSFLTNAAVKPKLLGVVWCYGLFNVHYEYVHNHIKNILILSTVIGCSIIAGWGYKHIKCSF